jgi:hypothetical protein
VRSGSIACRCRRRCGRPGRPGRKPVVRDGTPLLHQEAVDGGHQIGVGGRRRCAGSQAPGRPPRAVRRPSRPMRRGSRAPRARRHIPGTRTSSRPGGAGQAFMRRGGSRGSGGSAPSEAKSRWALRHCSIFTPSKEWLSSAWTSSSSSGGQRPVVPNVPSRCGAAGATGDLRELGRVQPAELVAVELAVGGEGDVVDIEIEAHADRVGGDEIVDIAGLKISTCALRVRGQRAEHHSRTAALAADQLGDGVDLVGREGDDGGASRQAGELLRSPAKRGSRSAGRVTIDWRRGSASRSSGAWCPPSSMVSSRPRRFRMRSVKTWPRSRSPAIWPSSTARNDTSISSGIASTVADPEARAGGLIFSSPVTSATLSRRHGRDDLGVDLACEEPQRQPDQPRGMRQHPLDREMRLAGVGGAEHRGDPPGHAVISERS